MKKLMSIAAVAAAMSIMAGSVSAADWTQTSYADNDPATVKIMSADADSVTFTTSETSTDICKARITLEKILKNPADYAKIAKMEWTVTYKGVSPAYTGTALAGGTYVTNVNSVGYKINADSVDEAGEHGTWNNSEYTITDSLDVVNPLVENGELVFMDWSFNDIGGAGITVTISDLKIFDASGAEIEQLGYGEFALVSETQDYIGSEVTTVANANVTPGEFDNSDTAPEDIYTPATEPIEPVTVSSPGPVPEASESQSLDATAEPAAELNQRPANVPVDNAVTGNLKGTLVALTAAAASLTTVISLRKKK